MQRKLIHKGKVYTVAFDDDGVLDTVTCEGKTLPSTNAVVKKILNNADRIRDGLQVDGFSRASRY